MRWFTAALLVLSVRAVNPPHQFLCRFALTAPETVARAGKRAPHGQCMGSSYGRYVDDTTRIISSRILGQ